MDKLLTNANTAAQHYWVWRQGDNGGGHILDAVSKEVILTVERGLRDTSQYRGMVVLHNAALDVLEDRTRLLREVIPFMQHDGVCQRAMAGFSNTKPADCDCGAHALLAEIREAVE